MMGLMMMLHVHLLVVRRQLKLEILSGRDKLRPYILKLLSILHKEQRDYGDRDEGADGIADRTGKDES